MSLLKSLLKLWSGEMFEEEKDKSREDLKDAKEAIKETRAMLDGEDNWLLPTGRKICDGK
jgi:hypothetical protein